MNDEKTTEACYRTFTLPKVKETEKKIAILKKMVASWTYLQTITLFAERKQFVQELEEIFLRAAMLASYLEERHNCGKDR